MHNLSTSAHATPIEFTHIDCHLGERSSQTFVIDLGSSFPSRALDTTLAPESQRTKKRPRSSVAQVPRYTQEGMFSRVHLTLPPSPYLQTPSWKRHSLTQKTTATSSPAGCPGSEQPRDGIDGGSKVVYANQDRGMKTRPDFSVKEKPSPARTRFRVRLTPNATGGAPFDCPPPLRAMPTKTAKKKPGQFFRQGKNLPSTHRM